MWYSTLFTLVDTQTTMNVKKIKKIESILFKNIAWIYVWPFLWVFLEFFFLSSLCSIWFLYGLFIVSECSFACMCNRFESHIVLFFSCILQCTIAWAQFAVFDYTKRAVKTVNYFGSSQPIFLLLWIYAMLGVFS